MAQRIDCLLAVLVGLLGVQVGQVYYISRLNAKCQCEEAQITLRQQFAGAQPSEQAENLLQELESLATGSTATERSTGSALPAAADPPVAAVSPPPPSSGMSTTGTYTDVTTAAVSIPLPAASVASSYGQQAGVVSGGGMGMGGGGMSLKQYLMQNLPHGLGIFLGVGTNRLPAELLRDWSTSPGLYLVDPYIHIWAGYDDASNLSDGEHQIVFERHQQELKPFEHRFSFVRDFSHSFLVTYKGTPGSPPISLLYVDNTQTHKAIVRDLDDWWGLMAPGGIAAGPQYNEKIEVKAGVNEFAAKMGLQVQLFADQQTWYLVKRG